MPFKKIAPAASINLSEDLQLKAFPRLLLERLSTALTTRLADIESPHHDESGPVGRPPTKKDRQRFTIWRGTASTSHEALAREFAFREDAGFELLKLFSNRFADKLAANPVWVPLEDVGFSKPNPLGFELQFVGEGELGWLEDKYGGLALCFLGAGELVWLYVKAEVGEGQIPLAAGNELPLRPLVEAKPPSGFIKFALTMKRG